MAQMVKNLPAMWENWVQSLGLGRSTGEGNGYRLQYSDLENSMDRKKVKVKSLSHVSLFATLWTAAHQAPLSMGFSRQEYWSGLPFPSPGDLPNPGIKPRSPALQADTLTSEPPGKPSWTEEPGILQFTESQRVGHDWATFTSFLCTI